MEWRKVYGNYLLSEFGDLKNDYPKKQRCRDTYRGRLLTPHVTKKGYLRVELIVNGTGKAKLVHRLVAEAFIGPCPVGKEVNHKDTNKMNNWYKNLEYITHYENIQHAIKHGLTPGRKGKP